MTPLTKVNPVYHRRPPTAHRSVAFARQRLADTAMVVVFGDDGVPLMSTSRDIPVPAAGAKVDDRVRAELTGAADLLTSREAAMTRGLVIGGRRLEVHRWHPEEGLCYGRDMSGPPDIATGWGLARLQGGPAAAALGARDTGRTPSWAEGREAAGDSASSGNGNTWALCVFEMPEVTARIVPLLRAFLDDVCGRGEAAAAAAEADAAEVCADGSGDVDVGVMPIPAPSGWNGKPGRFASGRK